LLIAIIRPLAFYTDVSYLFDGRFGNIALKWLHTAGWKDNNIPGYPGLDSASSRTPHKQLKI
jgi:hypothetical protein